MTTVIFTRHQDYAALHNDWQILKDLHEGRHEVLSTNAAYLWPHEFEARDDKHGRKMREIRQRISRYFNMSRVITNRYKSLLFKNGIVVPNEVRELFKGPTGADWFDNVDGDKTNFENFVKNHIAEKYLLYGKVLILTDSYGVKSASLADEISANVRPYWETLHPLSVVDWQEETNQSDRKGHLNFLRAEYQYYAQRSGPTEPVQPQMRSKVFYSEPNESGERQYFIEVYRQLTDDERRGLQHDKKEDAWTLVKEKTPIDLQEIPIAQAKGDSWIWPLHGLLLSLYNKESCRDSILLQQAHQKIIGIGDFSNKEDNEVVSNEGAWTILNGEGSFQVIEPADPIGLSKSIDDTKSKIIESAFNAQRTLPSESREMPGPEAMAREKEEFIDNARSAAKEIAEVVNEAIADWARFRGMEPIEEKVSIDPDITFEDVDQQMAILSSFMDRVSKYPKWRKAADKWAAARTVTDEEALEEILEEIENAPEEMAPQRPNLIQQALERNGGSEGNQPAEPAPEGAGQQN